MDTSVKSEDMLFNYRALRLVVGVIAFLFPVIVWIRASTITSSISASYHTDARDWFVGLLFVIGVLMAAYNGHPNTREKLVSTIGGFAAIITALYPTACDECTPDFNSIIHSIGAVILFSTTVYFCLVAFLRRAISKIVAKNNEFTFNNVVNFALKGDGEKSNSENKVKILRLRVYILCGLAISLILLVSVFLSKTLESWKITFWAETFALIFFGTAWMTASQYWFMGDKEIEKMQA